MQYKLYTTSIKAWDAMIEAIDGAKKSIFLEMYIFRKAHSKIARRSGGDYCD